MKAYAKVFNRLGFVLVGFISVLALINVTNIESELASVTVGGIGLVAYLMNKVRQNIRYISEYRLPQVEES